MPVPVVPVLMGGLMSIRPMRDEHLTLGYRHSRMWRLCCQTCWRACDPGGVHSAERCGQPAQRGYDLRRQQGLGESVSSSPVYKSDPAEPPALPQGVGSVSSGQAERRPGYGGLEICASRSGWHRPAWLTASGAGALKARCRTRRPSPIPTPMTCGCPM